MTRDNAAQVWSAGVLATLLLLTAPPSSVLAAEAAIDPQPDRFAEGENVRLFGSGFDPSYRTTAGEWKRVYVRIYLSAENVDVGDEIDEDVGNYEIVDRSEKVDEYGEWQVSFTAPSRLTDGEDDKSVRGGSYYVYATYRGDNTIVAAADCEVEETYFYCDARWHRNAYSPCWACCPTPWSDYCPSPWHDDCWSPWHDDCWSPWCDQHYSWTGSFRYSYPPLPLVPSDE